ncbi:flagellin [Clostridium homopropionicum DSM 5847]|uniref:Flagellin n=1 Tax=Clostridium homopropionicum DSM 5847 TaxID=1121318 RepID=A0A0L6ZDH7_9CLOT|nr:flagellin [Clostridium homopropionicum]KOA21020.1 flagellin [Clostridium homopropionicum DSM 5847]SFF99298.1 flagellin [Clostridium homopropionicum]
MRLMYNLESLNIYREHNKVLARQSNALESISSGYKINRAKDDPNALASSEKMRIQLRGLQMAQRNSQDGVSMLQTAEGALDSVTSMLQRIRELTVQVGGATNPDDRNIIQQEINQMIEGIDTTINNSEFNGVKLLNGSLNESISMPVGANVGENVEIPVYDLTSSSLPSNIDPELSLSKLFDKASDETDGLNVLGIDKALSIIDLSIEKINKVRSKYGALENRFESTYTKIGEIHDSIVGAESKVRDADMAEEMMNYTRDNILIEAGNAMMVQSNKIPQDVLRILENVKAR